MRTRGLIALACLVAAAAQAQEPPASGWIQLDPLRAEYVDHFTRVLPPALPPGAALRGGAAFEVEYVGFPAEAQAAFQRAVDLWSQHVTSTVPIRVRASWEPADDPDVLGATAPRVIANFERRPTSNTWYASALADALAGRDLDPDHPDMEASFNSAFSRWYFGLDGATPSGQFDFVTVVLHELGHGLGFVGSMDVEGARGRWGLGEQAYPVIFDRFTERGSGTPLLNTQVYPNPSEALAEALQSRDVFFDGPAAVRAQGGGRPELHAPRPWETGSSYSHLSEVRAEDGSQPYPPGSPNSLMTPHLGSAEAIHTPGPVTCAVFADLGWPLGAACQALLEVAPPPVACPSAPPYACGPYPNPAASGVGATVRFAVAESGRVRVEVFDVLGRRVGVLHDARVAAGWPGEVRVETGRLAAGIYLVRVTGPGLEATRQMTVVR